MGETRDRELGVGRGGGGDLGKEAVGWKLGPGLEGEGGAWGGGGRE